MIFDHVKILNIFSHLIKHNRFPHAVLFAGPSGIGKKTTALEITKYLFQSPKPEETFFEFSQKKCSCQVCNLIDAEIFPGIFKIEREVDFSIKRIREIREKLSLSSPYPFKIIILDNAENLSREATSALLKILEEPKGRTIFFLITTFPYILPRTILSRCEVFKFHPLSREEIIKFVVEKARELNLKLSEDKINLISDFSRGRPGIAKNILLDKNRLLYYNSLLRDMKSIEDGSSFKKMLMAERLEKEEKIDDFLFMAKCWFRDLLVIKNKNNRLSFRSKEEEIKRESESFSEERLKNILKEIQKTRTYLLFSNVSRLLTIENFLLRI